MTRAAVAILTTIVAFLWTYKGLRIVYAINDDVTMRNIASGSLSGTPDGHLVYIKYALGWIVSRMYYLGANLDWYGITMLGLVYACLALVLFRALDIRGSLVRRVTTIVLIMAGYALFGLEQAALFQYTVVAAALAGTALFWLCTSDTRATYSRFIDPGICALLLLLSYLVRSDVFLMCLPFAASAYIYQYLEPGGRKIRGLVLPASLVVGIAGASLIESAAYSTPQWKDFLHFNALRTEIFDYCGFPTYSGNSAFYQSIGVSEATFNLLSRYTFVPNPAANSRTLESIVARCEGASHSGLFSSATLSQANDIEVSMFGAMLEGRYATIATTCAVLFALLIARRRPAFGARDAAFLLSLLAIHLGIWFYLVDRGRYPDRVIWALYLIELLLLAGRTIDDARLLGIAWNKAQELTAIVLVIVLAGGAADYQGQIVAKAVDVQANINKGCERVYAYAAEHPQNFYFLSTHSFEDCTKTFSILTSDHFENYTFMGDWDYFSPPLLANFQKAGLGDIEQDLITRRDVLILIRPPDSISYLLDYYDSIHRGVVSRVVDSINIDDPRGPATVYNLEVGDTSLP